MTNSGYSYFPSAGETFDSVARTVYGHEKYAAELLCANPEYAHRTVFCGTEEVLLPTVYAPDEADGTPAAAAPWKEADA